MTDDRERFRWTCERALSWHGDRKAADFLAEIPTDAAVELTVGDATLPAQVAAIVQQLVS